MMRWRWTTLKFALICYAMRGGAAESSTPSVVSPNFKSCELMVGPNLKGPGEGGGESVKCGMAIWSQVLEARDGYMATIVTPETSQQSEYRLEMQDNIVNVFTSPVFGPGILPGDKTANSAAPSSNSIKSSASQEKPEDLTTKVSGTSAKASEMVEHSSGSMSSISSEIVIPATVTVTSPPTGVPSSSTLQHDAFVSRSPVPIAAFAIPLSAASGIVIVAGLLFLNKRRKLAKQRRQEFKTLALSRSIRDSEEYGSMGQVQHTMSILSQKRLNGYHDGPEPLPVPFSRSEHRVVTRSPFAPMGGCPLSSTIFDDGLGYYYGEDSTVMSGKSLTDHYTAAGKKPRSEDYTQAAPVIPPGLLPALMSPVHVRSHSPEAIHLLPVPPIHRALSMTNTADMYDVITAEVKRG